MINLAKASYATITNGTNNVVLVGANINGVVIHTGTIAFHGGVTSSGEIKLDGNILLQQYGTNGNFNTAVLPESVFVPPGVAIDITGAANVNVYLWYEVL